MFKWDTYVVTLTHLTIYRNRFLTPFSDFLSKVLNRKHVKQNDLLGFDIGLAQGLKPRAAPRTQNI